LTLHAAGTEKVLGEDWKVEEAMAMEGCASTVEMTRQ
jgi:hypothetical protein